MRRRILSLFMVLAFVMTASMIYAASTSWTGVISDSHCGAKHDKASPAAAACVEKCVKGGAQYVFVNSANSHVYKLVPQAKAKGHGGEEVTVNGKLEGDTIHVTSLTTAKAK